MPRSSRLFFAVVLVAGISCKQQIESESMSKKIILTNEAPAPIGPYSQAVKVGNTLYASGQIAIDPENGEMVNSTLEEECRQVMKNIGAVLKASDMNYRNVVKTSIFLSDMDNFTEVNRIYAEYFPSEPPARETVEVARLPKDVRVEMSVVAVD